MSSWIDETAVPNHNGNGFPHINDPSTVAGSMMDPSAFVANPAQFNPQFANPLADGHAKWPDAQRIPFLLKPNVSNKLGHTVEAAEGAR